MHNGILLLEAAIKNSKDYITYHRRQLENYECTLKRLEKQLTDLKYPPMDFSEALKALKEGKKIKRKSWINTKYIYRSGGEIHYEGCLSRGKYEQLYYTDVFATDWQIVE